MTAIERAQRDLECGEHWLARQRLESFLVTKGYDPEILSKLGEISHEMHDSYNAGRMWLTSTSEGSHVDRAIETFIRYAGSDPKQIVCELPRAVRLTSIAGYPSPVQQRLRRLGLADVVVVSGSNGSKRSASSRWVGWISVLVIVLVLAFCVTSCSVGAVYMFSWFFGGD